MMEQYDHKETEPVFMTDEEPSESAMEKINGGCTMICPRCDGTGVYDGQPCFSCGGTGWRR